MNFFANIMPLDESSLKALNIAFHVIHLALLAFVIFGVFSKRLVRFHFPVLIIIWLSWTALGIYVGTIGYCPITDWHWQVKRALGEYGMPPSYIAYALTSVTGEAFNKTMVSLLTMAGMLVITAVSGFRYFHWRNQ